MPTTTAAQQARALDEIAKRTGQDLRTMSRQEQVRALQRLFGTPRAAR